MLADRIRMCTNNKKEPPELIDNKLFPSADCRSYLNSGTPKHYYDISTDPRLVLANNDVALFGFDMRLVPSRFTNATLYFMAHSFNSIGALNVSLSSNKQSWTEEDNNAPNNLTISKQIIGIYSPTAWSTHYIDISNWMSDIRNGDFANIMIHPASEIGLEVAFKEFILQYKPYILFS